MRKRQKASPRPLPQGLLERIACFIDTPIVFFSTLEVLPRSKMDPFLSALYDLATVVTPWCLWPVLQPAAGLAQLPAAYAPLVKRVLESHPRVVLEASSPQEYFGMLSSTASVQLRATDSQLLWQLADTVAIVTSLHIDFTASVSLQSLLQHLVLAPRLRSLALDMDVRALSTIHERYLKSFIPILCDSLQSVTLALTGQCGEQVPEATVHTIARLVASLPVTQLRLDSVATSEHGARRLYDAILDAKRLSQLKLFACDDLAGQLAVLGAPWVCMRRHTHEVACRPDHCPFPSLLSWTMATRKTDLSQVFATLRRMPHLQHVGIQLLYTPDEDATTLLLSTLGQLHGVRALTLSGPLLLQDTRRVTQVIHMLSELQHLSALRLVSSDLGSTGLRLLVQALQHRPKWTAVDLRWNDLTDVDVPLLETLVDSPQVRTLWLGGNKLSDDAKDQLESHAWYRETRPLAHLALDDAEKGPQDFE